MGGTTPGERVMPERQDDLEVRPTEELGPADLDATPRVHPLELPPTSRRDLARRARQISLVTTRHFTPLALRSALTRRIAPDAYARPLRRTFEELGATFMKFGQLIGSSPGIFGDDVAAEFRSCLDTGPAVPFEKVRRAVEFDLGMPLDEAFWSFSETPIGTRLHLRGPQGDHPRRPTGGGQGAAPGHRAPGGNGPRPVPAAAGDRRPADRRVRRGPAAGDVPGLPPADRRGARPAQRGPGHGPLPARCWTRSTCHGSPCPRWSPSCPGPGC